MDRRPRAITYLCFLLFVGGTAKALQALSLFIFHSDKAAVFALITSCLALISYLGLWIMQRWGVYLFLAVWLLSLYPRFSPVDVGHSHIHSVFTWVMLAIYLVVVMPYWHRLSAPKDRDKAEDA